ncbi:hypothetical protein [Sciscionella marina]|uniref:hypothetical protein n=1 Tax=Sciscionella marina TaxID=508770 RepID=UPI0003A57689|nr:hypothetical protein [Sciscionella marina]
MRMRAIAVVLSLLIVITNYLDRGTLGIADTGVAGELGASASTMGLLLSVFFWAYAFAQLPAGAMLGVGEAPTFPANAKVIAALYPAERRGTLIGLLNAASSMLPPRSAPRSGCCWQSCGWPVTGSGPPKRVRCRAGNRRGYRGSAPPGAWSSVSPGWLVRCTCS